MPLMAAKYCPPLLKHTSRQPLMGICITTADKNSFLRLMLCQGPAHRLCCPALYEDATAALQNRWCTVPYSWPQALTSLMTFTSSISTFISRSLSANPTSTCITKQPTPSSGRPQWQPQASATTFMHQTAWTVVLQAANTLDQGHPCPLSVAA